MSPVIESDLAGMMRFHHEQGFHNEMLCLKIRKRLWKVENRIELADGTQADLKPFYYITRDGWKIQPPDDFITDFASVPRAFWIFYPPDGTYTKAAVIHDFLCEKQCFPYEWVHRIFREAMEDLPDVPKGTERNMGWAVKRFGPRWEFNEAKAIITRKRWEIERIDLAA